MCIRDRSALQKRSSAFAPRVGQIPDKRRDPAQNTASRRPFCLRKSSSHRRLVTSNRGQSHRAADGEAALIDGLCHEESSRSAGECVDLVLHFNTNTTIWISPCRWKKLADGLGSEAGLLSSQKQEIQVCERTRPNKKYPGLGPCSESRASLNDSPRYFLFALVLPHQTAARQRRPSRLQMPV